MQDFRKRVVNKAIVIIYTAIAAILIFYFIFFNNSQIISYSFMAFAALGLVTAHKDRLVKYFTIISLIIIVSSSLAYFFIQGSAYSVFAINLAIIGYYLLISTVIALLAYMVASGSNIHPIRKVIAALGMTWRYIQLPILVIGMLAIVMPIWPVGSSVNYSLLPHASLNINSIDNPTVHTADSIYLLTINLSNYSGVLNPQGSNLRILYQNGTKAKAAEYTIGAAQVGNYTKKVLIESKLSAGSLLNIYFYPFNVSYGRNFSSMPAKLFNKAAASAHAVNLTVSHLSNVLYKPMNETITLYAAKPTTSYDNYTIEMMPFYDLQEVCSMGNFSKEYISFTSNNTVSMFIFDNLSSFMNSTVNISPSYGSYISSFYRNSGMRKLNASNASIGLPLDGCAYYSFVARNESKILLHTLQDYISYAPYTVKKTFYLPTIENATQRHGGFIWNSMEYTLLHALRNVSNGA